MEVLVARHQNLQVMQKSKNYLMQNSIWHKLKSPKQNRTALAIILGEAEIPRD
jgi:hypothetical protein